MRKINKIILHHTSSPMKFTTLGTIRQAHEQRGLGSGIQYHYTLIGREIKQTRTPTKVGNHCWGNNEDSIGVALAGNFEIEEPTNDQIYNLRRLLKKLYGKYDLRPANVYAHRDIACPGHETLCPGKNMKAVLDRVKAEAFIKDEQPVETPKPTLAGVEVQKKATWWESIWNGILNILAELGKRVQGK